MRRILILAAAAAVPSLALAATHVPTLAGIAGGLWELSGVPGSHVAVRQCILDPMLFAQYEHRGRRCTRTIVSDNGRSMVVNYDCGGAGFGHTDIEVLTPRSLRISTQGISDQLPFGYTLQAHRIGTCEDPVPARH